jgi:adenylylsulfate kinase
MTDTTSSLDIVWHDHAITKETRAKQKKQTPCVLWFTGLSGSGKSTLAGALEQALAAQGYHTYLLDGDNVRHGLCEDLSFSDSDRQENIRRVGEVSKLMVDAGLIVLTAFISPHQAERHSVRNRLKANEFFEIFVDTPLSECERRDPKGLYQKARSGQLANFTGIDSVYEAPADPEIHIKWHKNSLEQDVALCLSVLTQQGIIL